LRDVLFDTVAALPADGARDCACGRALGGADPGIVLP
ncbi:5'-methylthioadenosine phosphorylase, partial [Streptomyces sp. TRM76130]|nr:5'-methylthioadenosine phosphorylase [Streptomyces sp. TRM76130]